MGRGFYHLLRLKYGLVGGLSLADPRLLGIEMLTEPSLRSVFDGGSLPRPG